MSSRPPGLLSDEILSKGEGVNYICLIKIGATKNSNEVLSCFPNVSYRTEETFLLNLH